MDAYSYGPNKHTGYVRGQRKFKGIDPFDYTTHIDPMKMSLAFVYKESEKIAE